MKRPYVPLLTFKIRHLKPAFNPKGDVRAEVGAGELVYIKIEDQLINMTHKQAMLFQKQLCRCIIHVLHQNLLYSSKIKMFKKKLKLNRRNG